MDSLHDLSPEIKNLHRDIFWTRCISVTLFLALAGLLFATWRRHSKTLEGSQLVLRDDAGAVFAKLAKSKNGDACLTLESKGNASAADLCVQDLEGAFLDLHNLKSNSRAMLSPGFYMREGGRVSPALVLNDGQNAHTFHVYLGSESKLEMDHNSNESVVVSSTPERAKNSLFDESGKPHWSTP